MVGYAWHRPRLLAHQHIPPPTHNTYTCAHAKHARPTGPRPAGTNSSLFQPLRPTRVALEEVGAFPSDDLSEDVRTGLFFEYLRAQDERGYDGTFAGEGAHKQSRQLARMPGKMGKRSNGCALAAAVECARLRARGGAALGVWWGRGQEHGGCCASAELVCQHGG